VLLKNTTSETCSAGAAKKKLNCWKNRTASPVPLKKNRWASLKKSDCSTSATEKCSVGACETCSAGIAGKKRTDRSAGATEKIGLLHWHHRNWIALLALLKKILDCSASAIEKKKSDCSTGTTWQIRLLHWCHWKKQTALLVPLKRNWSALQAPLKKILDCSA